MKVTHSRKERDTNCKTGVKTLENKILYWEILSSGGEKKYRITH